MNSAHGEGKIVLDTNCPEIMRILRYNAPLDMQMTRENLLKNIHLILMEVSMDYWTL